MKFLKKNDNWVTPMGIDDGIGDSGDWSYEDPFAAGDKN